MSDGRNFQPDVAAWPGELACIRHLSGNAAMRALDVRRFPAVLRPTIPGSRQRAGTDGHARLIACPRERLRCLYCSRNVCSEVVFRRLTLRKMALLQVVL